MGTKTLNLTFYTDDLEYSYNPGFTVFLSPFGTQYLAQVDLIFPINHPSEFTFIDITSQGEPFRQHICFKGPIKDTINLSQTGNRFINTTNLLSYSRIFSKSLIDYKLFDTIIVNAQSDYDPYLSNLDTRSSLYMNLASNELSPLDSNFNIE
jgi:hypothetical protein